MTSDQPPDDRESPQPDAPASSRRTILGLGVGALGCGLAAVSVAPIVRAWTEPLGRGRVTGPLVTVGKRSAFGVVPVRVDLLADRVDAWTREREVKLGSCWVLEQDGVLQAFSTVCPHLGCAIDFDGEVNKFKCPCHRSSFGLGGEVEEGPSPRPLDTLEVEETDGLVAIRVQRFRLGVATKEPT